MQRLRLIGLKELDERGKRKERLSRAPNNFSFTMIIQKLLLLLLNLYELFFSY